MTVKVLLSDGSGLTARQVAGRLAAMGHVVEVLSPDPLCLCRFTGHVRRVHRVPSSRFRRAFLRFSRTIQATSGSVLTSSRRNTAIPSTGSAAITTLQP